MSWSLASRARPQQSGLPTNPFPRGPFPFGAAFRRDKQGDAALKLLIRPLEAQDVAPMTDAFAALGWNKPASQYERYLAEQQAGETGNACRLSRWRLCRLPERDLADGLPAVAGSEHSRNPGF